jgi:uncharacterized protein (DUF2237 family)
MSASDAPELEKEPPRNVLGQPLVVCSMAPRTGFFRDGCCSTGPSDTGRHVVCAVMTEGFLEFSRARGNDLSTPRPEYRFPGLRPGDRWCLCALRWKEALEAGKAPMVILEATHEAALRYVTIDDLLRHAAVRAEA